MPKVLKQHYNKAPSTLLKKVGLQIFFFNSLENKVLICFNVQALVFLSISTFATQVGKGNIQKHGISMPWAPVPVVKSFSSCPWRARLQDLCPRLCSGHAARVQITGQKC